MSSIRNADWDRPENIWSADRNSGTYIGGFLAWWSNFHRDVWEQVGAVSGVALWKEILGPQTATVVLRNRNWVWVRPEEGWALYVSKRGPAFHVRHDATPDEAWKSFEHFKNRAIRGLSSYGKPKNGVKRNYGPGSE